MEFPLIYDIIHNNEPKILFWFIIILVCLLYLIDNLFLVIIFYSIIIYYIHSYIHINKIKESYATQTTPYYAAARLWVDAIIDPVATRSHIAEAIAAADNNPEMGIFNTGVFQV